MEPKSNTGKIIGGLVVLAVGTVSIIAANNSSTPATPADTTTTGGTGASTTTPSTVVSTPQTTTTTTKPTTTPVTVKPTPVTSTTAYKNGTYSATGSYFSPGGPDQLGVTLTITNDIVTSATVTPEAGDGTSARYQQRFISGYTPYVVGQNIASIHLTRVSGSSLTPIGFNDALSQIKAKAKA